MTREQKPPAEGPCPICKGIVADRKHAELMAFLVDSEERDICLALWRLAAELGVHEETLMSAARRQRRAHEAEIAALQAKACNAAGAATAADCRRQAAALLDAAAALEAAAIAGAVSLADALAMALAARLGGEAEPTVVGPGGLLRVRVLLPPGPIVQASPLLAMLGDGQPLAGGHLDVQLRPDGLPTAEDERDAWVAQACEWLAQATLRDLEERAATVEPG